ncbi:MAG TPA: DUF2254 domain-containing protein [Blastocatellia bacterium]|nr:DUF2254 domain-containing protein [Blastocatellia bacterium]
MTWLQRYRIRHYIRNSIVVLPVLGIVAAVLTAWSLHSIEKDMGWESERSVEAVRIVIGTLAAAMLTFIVFLSSTLLLAVQLASAQLTPRIIAFVFRDPVTKFSLTVFVFTFTLSLAILIRVDGTVPLVTPRLAAWSCVVSLCVFFYLIDHIGKSLRPSGVLKQIGLTGRKVIVSVYPRRLDESPETPRTFLDALDEHPRQTIASPVGGVLLDFDVDGLTALARNAGCLVELVPQVGDFVATDDPLFRVYQGGATVSVYRLCQCVAVGQERTHEQDPGLAFRIIVDMASKGLSPAINDPTTAVLAIDQIHHLLRKVGSRHLYEGVIRDESGQARLVYRTPVWQDFVQLAVTEIRQFGGSSIQIIRRLRAMLENLIETLPEERTAVLRRELDLLQRTADRFFVEPEERALASAGDSQGMGGASEWGHKRREVPRRFAPVSGLESGGRPRKVG